jgi:hypothetical protein
MAWKATSSGGAAVPVINSALILLVLAALNIGLMAVLHWQVPYLVADGAASDAFFAALAIPYFLLSVFTPAVTPLVTSRLVRNGGEMPPGVTAADLCWEASWQLTGIAMTIAALLASISFLLIPWLFTGLTPVQLSMVSRLVWVLALIFPASLMTQVQSGFFQAAGRPGLNEALGLVAAVVACFAMPFLFAAQGLLGLAFGLVLKPVLQALLGAVFIGAPRRMPRRLGNLDDVKSLAIAAGPISILKAEIFVDRYLLSQASPGQLTAFHLVSQVAGAAQSVAVRAIVVPAIPEVVLRGGAADAGRVRSVLRQVLFKVVLASLLSFPVLAVAVWLLRHATPLGQSPVADVLESFTVLYVALGGVVVLGAVGNAVGYVFYANGRVQVPGLLGLVPFAIGMPLKVAGFFWGGTIGLAIATSVYFGLTAAIVAWGAKVFMLGERTKAGARAR